MARRRKCFVRDVIQAVSEIAPPRLAESWDNVGLQVGDPSRAVKRIMTCLEVSENIVEEAVGRQVDVVISHHPLIFKPLRIIDGSQPVGAIISRLVRDDIAVISAHTNLDSACWSTNTVLAEKLGFEAHAPLVVAGEQDGGAAGARIPGPGLRTRPSRPLGCRQLVQHVKQAMGLERVRCSGPGKEEIVEVALCTGSGGGFIGRASMVADAYITGELTYHHAVEAAQRDLMVIEVGHYESEVIVVEPLSKRLLQTAVLKSCDVEVLAAGNDFQPFRFA